MSAVVFDGKQFALERERVVKKKVSNLDFIPKLVSVFFVEDSASVLYTRLKQKAAERVGVDFFPEELSLDAPLTSIQNVVAHFSHKKSVHGVMVQKPSRNSVAEVEEVGEFGYEEWWRRIVDEISIKKDVDCLNPVNLEMVYRGKWERIPATVKAVLSILKEVLGLDSAVRDKKIAVVGRSEIVGKPLAHVLSQMGAEVYLCGSGGLAAKSIGSQLSEEIEPEDLASVISKAEIVVSATGKADLISGEMIKKGAVVIDVGETQGDVNFESVCKKAKFITPVPGGVGPVTVVSLLENLVELIENM